MIGRYWTNLEKTALPTGPALKMLAVNPFKHVQAPRLLALGACSWRREENTCLQDKQASAKNLSDMILRLGSVGSHLIAFYESSCVQGKQTYPCLRLCLCLGHFCQALRKLNCFQQTEPLDGKMLRLLRKTRED